LLHLNVRSPVYFRHHTFNLLSHSLKLFEVITEYFNSQLRANTGQQLVKAHLYRLQKFITTTRNSIDDGR